MKRLLALTLSATLPALAAPPQPKQVPHVTRIHGLELQDEYFWMRNRKDPDTLAYLKAENKYTESVLAPTKKLRNKLYKEMLSHLKEDDQRPPYREGNFSYFSKTAKGLAYPVFCRYPVGQPQKVQLLLDLNAMAKGKSFLDLGHFEVSPNGEWLAYSLDTTGYRQYRLHFKNMRTGRTSTQSLERVTSVAWANDNKTLYVTTEDPVSKRSDRFWRMTLGSRAKPRELFYEKDELFDINCGRSRDGKMVLLHSFAKTSTECQYRPADASDTPLKVLQARRPEHEYEADHFGDRFFIRSNEGTHVFQALQGLDSNPGVWTRICELDPNVHLEEFEIFPGKLAMSVREAGVPGLWLLDLGSRKFTPIELPERVRSLELGSNVEPDEPFVRIVYESPITPSSTYDVDLKSAQLKLIKRQEVPLYEAGCYGCERYLARARDGVQVPVTLVYRKGTQAGPGHPMLLEAYGSYGVTDDPSFSGTRLSLLDRGVVYAYAHIRGGGDLGEPWRQAGRMFKKQTTFDDFVDCAEDLTRAGWTRSDKLVITGGSAGGLLMGAVINQKPELFQAVIAKVPFVDVINTMLDESLPLTTSEFVEWGNPKEKAAFDYMRSYSPYDNVGAKNYPHMLVKVSLNDSQVPYWEGAKWVARLRQRKTGEGQILLHTNLQAGHGGSSSRYEQYRERAFDYAYALWQMGIKE